MIDVKNLAGIFAKKLADNSPAILTGIGAAGVITTAALAVKATPAAMQRIEKKQLERFEVSRSSDLEEPYKDLTKFEVVKVVWKEYLPAGLVAVASISAIVAANTVSTRRYAAIATAYSVTERAYTEYREKTVDKMGRVKEEEMRSELGREQYDRAAANNEIVWLGDGTTQFWDASSARAFKSTMETVKRAENEINFEIINGSYASLNDFWAKLGLPTTRMGEELGWTLSEPLSLQSPVAMVLPDNTPAIVIDFNTDPVRNYNRLG